jgi:hypothetical protein
MYNKFYQERDTALATTCVAPLVIIPILLATRAEDLFKGSLAYSKTLTSLLLL